jgi:hypothetical protein
MPGVRRVLVTGWWSFLHGEATAGDLDAGATAAAWLAAAGVAHDVAWSPVLATFTGGPTLEECDPADYTDLLFVCGPLAGWQVEALCERFAACRRTAIGVSVVDGGASGRFDVVIPRDAADSTAADLSLGRPGTAPWPLVVVVRANPQPEYGGRCRHDEVHAAIDAQLATVAAAVVDADTRIDPRHWRQRDGRQLDALLSAADVVVTTRLHGLVLALRAGTPAVAVDPVDGGAKVTAQARALGWPALLGPEDVIAPGLADALAWCRTAPAADAVRHSLAAAGAQLEARRARLLDAVGQPS